MKTESTNLTHNLCTPVNDSVLANQNWGVWKRAEVRVLFNATICKLSCFCILPPICSVRLENLKCCQANGSSMRKASCSWLFFTYQHLKAASVILSTVVPLWLEYNKWIWTIRGDQLNCVTLISLSLKVYDFIDLELTRCFILDKSRRMTNI